jgi:hypothetical protein
MKKLIFETMKKGIQTKTKKKLFNIFPPRKYYSSFENNNDIKDKILKKSIEYVPLYGWTTDSLSMSCKYFGLTEMSHGSLLINKKEFLSNFN